MEDSLNTKIKVKIRAALKGQTTGLIASEIRERAGIKDNVACNVALRQMKVSGELTAHLGDTPHKTRYSVNTEYASAETESTPTKRKTAKKKPGRKPGKKRAARTPAAPEPSAIDQEFVPALTVDHGLVLVTKGMHPPKFFSPEETVAIATLLGANFHLE